MDLVQAAQRGNLKTQKLCNEDFTAHGDWRKTVDCCPSGWCQESMVINLSREALAALLGGRRIADPSTGHLSGSNKQGFLCLDATALLVCSDLLQTELGQRDRHKQSIWMDSNCPWAAPNNAVWHWLYWSQSLIVCCRHVYWLLCLNNNVKNVLFILWTKCVSWRSSFKNLKWFLR